MNPKLAKLFCQHVAASFDKQMHLADLLGERPWRFNKDRGLLSFGNDIQWQTQILGTESEGNQTWLWAWANEASQIPANLLQAANAMREFGTRNGIREMTDPEVPLEQADGHSLSSLASGLLDARAYYRGPYKGGAVFLLITDPLFPRPSENPVLRISSNFCQVISTYEIENQREAFEAYLRYYSLPSRPEASRVLVLQGEKPLLVAEFDGLNRLVRLESTISPSGPGEPSKKKPWWKVW